MGGYNFNVGQARENFLMSRITIFLLRPRLVAIESHVDRSGHTQSQTNLRSSPVYFERDVRKCIFTGGEKLNTSDVSMVSVVSLTLDLLVADEAMSVTSLAMYLAQAFLSLPLSLPLYLSLFLSLFHSYC